MRLIQFLTALMLTAGAAVAQGQFSPAVQVNDDVITVYELQQRARLLELFRTPGDPNALAREQLIEDRLKQQAIDQRGLRLTDEALQAELEAFAGRANLSLDQFNTLLAQNGVDQKTLADFVRIGVTWRDYIRSRYGNQAQISDAEVDAALGRAGSNDGSGIEVLLSEIIIPAPPPRAAQALARAQQISQLTSTAAFEAQARQVSALPSKARGGRLDWLPISNYPPQLRSIILDLAPGQVTAPIQIPNGVALFQMRAVREVPQAPPAPTAIEYAAFYLPAGSDGGVTAAQQLAARVDTCDDLYGEARGLPQEVLERASLPVAEIPQDVAMELARLDAGEVSYNLTRAAGDTRVFLMLCSRQFGEGGAVDREAVRNQLRSQRLAGFAAALLEDLRASATITNG
ncbi:periplasmic chaperone for outer membrane proteins SurA [Cognatiyoonia koreensis]|uniref:Parvulin-like PPIase n=1 Tax=Cognatiyoonia koreensis TaxID=364200 RepID=A0A1I0NY74_9RHOB|nr:peptidylprolyl isomerase [Cognatiyoonia koreensis]SEW06787.1 periplasmic chaperone for outer membrane proteins SurA [Cognatiyoonia koreensis]